MGPFLYVMAIIGCTDDGLDCRQVRLVEARYVSMAACHAAAEAQLIAHSDIDFPQILASCTAATNRIADSGQP
ncbi:hypothetical protein GVO57_02500 [Sphingomonas changnyeongensis]|uniref:Uncharacterized protein n=1 Tax=Sphingomonas changnyeongensis TaxID=2698679 RepID=A0A7Z2NU60_9SPHN|nr:hypothetical protein [Sphingomonas changnyeongensis]QHL89900.1 hypothetical protein GVO57_02500 [Sphingomonas changnyeongensis]